MKTIGKSKNTEAHKCVWEVGVEMARGSLKHIMEEKIEKQKEAKE
jgi:hypothetical protein